VSTSPVVHHVPSDFDGTRDRIVELRCQGKSIHYISTAMGLSSSEVQRLLRSEFEQRLGDRQGLIQKAAMELDYLMAKLMDKIVVHPDRRDMETWLKFNESKRRLFGLDAPTKVEAKVSYEEMSEQDIVRQLQIEAPNLLPALPPVEDAEFVGIGETELESASSRVLSSPPLSVPSEPPTSTPARGEPAE